MSTYRIRPGDSLSAIAARTGTTVSELRRTNRIANPNLIRAGQVLQVPQVPGGASVSSSSRAATSAISAFEPAVDCPASPALDLARDYLGWNAGDLKLAHNEVGLAMADWVPNTLNCANFVSGVLRAAGQLEAELHSNSVVGLMQNLDTSAAFERVRFRDAAPGDVVSMETRTGHHVALFAGWQAGRAIFVGSNNVNADGSQRVSIGPMGYPILAVHRFVG